MRYVREGSKPVEVSNADVAAVLVEAGWVQDDAPEPVEADAPKRKPGRPRKED